jgi:transposase InsO family protein/transposase-like protein
MPWRKTEPMEERLKLIADWLDGYTITDLSVFYDVSRKTIYKWIERYNELGLDGLKELSRAPVNHPNQTDEKVIERLVKEKQLHMGWGPEKLLDLLHRDEPDIKWPSVCIAEKWLKRYGLVRKRRLRKGTPRYSEPFLACDTPNKVWSADYKGQFKTGDGRWCYPLTITDNMSRYLFMCKGLYSPCYAETQPWFEWAFREFGLPEAIRTDNGTPFAGRGVSGLSRLSVWWIKLGIRPERIESGKPYQNGRHERMHRTLKQDTAKPPKSDMSRQQLRFDEFRHEYNYDRPHEALNKETPASVYKPSPRKFPEKLREPEYDLGVEVRTVHHQGELRYRKNHYFLSELLAGEKVGLVEIAEGTYEILFGFHPIGILDARLRTVGPKLIKV